MPRSFYGYSKEVRRELDAYQTVRAGTLPLDLKVGMVKTEAVEASLYSCVAWITRHYVPFTRRHRSEHRIFLYNRTLELPGSGSIDEMLRARRWLWAGALIRMDDGRLPKCVMFRKIEDMVKKGRGSQEKEWATCVECDVQSFNTH